MTLYSEPGPAGRCGIIPWVRSSKGKTCAQSDDYAKVDNVTCVPLTTTR